MKCPKCKRVCDCPAVAADAPTLTQEQLNGLRDIEYHIPSSVSDACDRNDTAAPEGPWWLHSAEGGWTLLCFEERGGFEDGTHLSETHGFTVEDAEAVRDELNRLAQQGKTKKAGK